MLITRNIKGFERLRAYRLMAAGDLLITDTLAIKAAIKYATLVEGWSTLEDVSCGDRDAALVTRPYFGRPVANLVRDGMPDDLRICVLRPLPDCPYFAQIRAAINRRYQMEMGGEDVLVLPREREPRIAPKPFGGSRRFILNPYHSKPIPI